MLQAVQNTDTVTLVGYLDAVSSDGHWRLYKDPAVELYVQVRVDDVVEVSSADPGQSRISVRRDAGVVWHESMPASIFDSDPTTTPRGFKWPRP